MSTQQVPYLLRISEQALALRDTLLLPTTQDLTELRPGAKPVEIERTLSGYRIPHLPDLLTSPHLAGQTERERLTEVLDRQTRLVANLGKWKGMAFSLRYLWRPERGEVDTALVVRGLAKPGDSRRLGEEMALDVFTLLRGFDFPVEPIVTETELRNILEPVPNPMVVEIRQHEEVVSLMQGDAYVVYPFRAPTTTWIPVFETLLAQRAACFINVYLEPTRLYDQERQLFAQASALAETLADFTFEGLAYRGRVADPQAKMVARLYSNYLQRLTDPFLLVIQVASVDPATSRAVAQALGVEITEIVGISEAADEGAQLPAGFDVVIPESMTDLAAAWRILRVLDLYPWGEGQASPGKERLRYLVDARGASAAFRFPVPLRGGVPGIRTRQPLPAFEPGRRVKVLSPDQFLVGKFVDRPGLLGIPLEVMNKHVLVAGTTGSGKTTTCMQLLAEMWARKIPFLVIEPAKSEYRTLLRSPFGSDLQIFTLGDEGVSPFRLNPLQILPGVRVETHVSHLRTCFEAALPTFGILPSLIEEALHNLYAHHRWRLTDRAGEDEPRLMPTLGELYHEVIRVAEKRGYSQKTMQDVRAAAAGRIATLLRGSKGRMLNTRLSLPFEDLMKRPTILELEALNDEEKALVMLFLLAMIREYCRTTRESQRLRHVTLVEEAHRVMAAVPRQADREIAADTRAEAVEMFSAALSELRAFGEGLIVAEQIPARLAADAIKNTNVKIVHRLPGKDDRLTIGATMNLGEEQESYLTKLSAGEAAVFAEGFEKPTFILVHDYRGEHSLPERVADHKVGRHMKGLQGIPRELFLPFEGCRYCPSRCDYRDQVEPIAFETGWANKFEEALATFMRRRGKAHEKENWMALADTCNQQLRKVALEGDANAGYCLFMHMWREKCSKALHDKFLRGFQALTSAGE